MDTIINAYTFAVTNENGDKQDVSLRISLGEQVKLKKKYNKSTTATLFDAIDDVEVLIDVVDRALRFKGNHNTVASGEDLLDLMAINGLLGVSGKQRLIVNIGYHSGIFSKREKERLDRKADGFLDAIDDDNKDEKNA